MLLRFGVANHRSIRDYQELFLSASRRIKREGLVIPVPTLKEAAVPVAAVYGPNAAGKSNLIDAICERGRRFGILKAEVPCSAQTAWVSRWRRSNDSLPPQTSQASPQP